MNCKCGEPMVCLCADVYIELYVCPDCLLYALVNIEISENITYLRESDHENN